MTYTTISLVAFALAELFNVAIIATFCVLQICEDFNGLIFFKGIRKTIIHVMTHFRQHALNNPNTHLHPIQAIQLIMRVVSAEYLPQQQQQNVDGERFSGLHSVVQSAATIMVHFNLRLFFSHEKSNWF